MLSNSFFICSVLKYPDSVQINRDAQNDFVPSAVCFQTQ